MDKKKWQPLKIEVMTLQQIAEKIKVNANSSCASCACGCVGFQSCPAFRF